MTVYFIPGLAADRTVFKYIELPAGFTAVYLDWITPLQQETLSNYAIRVAEKIDTSKPFVLIGLSFGGMLAVEIAKRWPPVCIILISSVPVVQHLPYYYRLAGRLRLHKVIPISFIQHASILKRLFTTETGEDKRILKAMIRKSNVHFIRWAMQAALSWKNTIVPENLIHIHGTKDEVLPHCFTNPKHTIPRGGHLMVLNRAKEINSILSDVFMNLPESRRC